MARRVRSVETSPTIFLLRSPLICCSLRGGRESRDDVDVVGGGGGDDGRPFTVRMSDQKISALMTRTNERRTEKEISRLLNVHPFSVWADQLKLSEARPDLAIIYLPSSPVRS